ncbi:hypothetical protein GCK72_004141 [Caenorhabditis remanei]|uniref:F-box domain-containing protein n=1 Tax=Caenorhabditis remanei TaxID=31234 RepID=A0A6A5HBM1_CAERE|nr:hypothetical protein GCK72_004141 [Caenorhabditis remanei]KAF1764194.1 hypothetical protein GCK72_004141 [Caenorhabditis remanei]
MNSRPLSYESLKTVLKYMDPNKRFLLASRCPSIRSADKATPLIIDTFHYNENSFEVNRTVYKIGIYKNYLIDAETPQEARRYNALGGMSKDLDQYGFEDLSGENTLTPGDVDLRKPNDEGWRPENMDDDERIAEYEHELANTKSRLTSLKCSVNVHPFYDEKEQEDRLHTKIKSQMARLQPFYSRRDGLPVPFKSYIQLTITSGNGKPYIERLEYTKKLHEAVKYLTANFFGNRLHPVVIGRFRVYDEVMRFPVGLRLDVQSLSVSNIQIVQESLGPLLTNTVKKLNVEVKSAGDFECAMLKNAEILSLQGGGSGIIRPPMVLNLTNLKANIVKLGWTVEDFMTIVRWWVEDVEKEVGTSYKFVGFWDKNIIKDLIESIKRQYEEAKEIGELSMAIPTKYGSYVNVSKKEVKSYYNKQPYDIIFEVVPKESDLPVV